MAKKTVELGALIKECLSYEKKARQYPSSQGAAPDASLRQSTRRRK